MCEGKDRRGGVDMTLEGNRGEWGNLSTWPQADVT